MRVPVAFLLAPDMWIPIKWLEPEDMEEGSFAEYNYNLSGGWIDISKSIKPKYLEMVLIHEIRHSIFYNCGWHDTLKKYHPELEESINEVLDFGLRGIIKIEPDSKRFKWREIDL